MPGRWGTVHQVAIREHREPFYPKVGNWNRFSANTGGTLVEKCCHYFNLMEFILGEPAQRVFASGGQRVNHLDERYDGRVPDILDSAFVVVEYASGARASLDLCMFAENSIDNEHVTIVGSEGKLESLLPSGVLRFGRREDWGRREVWGQPSGTARGVSVRQIRDTNIKYLGQHFGASYVEHQKFAQAVRDGSPRGDPARRGAARRGRGPGRAPQHRRGTRGGTVRTAARAGVSAGVGRMVAPDTSPQDAT
jgi:myo-inositol 2-dehydrogenase/D-chiro-inositol 1-dehydrogenase